MKSNRVERRKEETSHRLLDAAMRLFSVKGVYLTTVEEITEEADVGKGTFYDYFPSKNALIQQLVRMGLEELQGTIEAHLARVRNGRDVVPVLLEVQFRFFKKRPDLLVFFHQVRGLLKLQTEGMEAIQAEYDRYIGFLAEELKPAFQRKRWSEAKLRQVACALAGSVAGYLSFATILPPDGRTNEHWEIPKRIFLQGVYKS